jgi:hypothetical protein
MKGEGDERNSEGRSHHAEHAPETDDSGHLVGHQLDTRIIDCGETNARPYAGAEQKK